MGAAWVQFMVVSLAELMQISEQYRTRVARFANNTL